jgi:hypothetical protein
MSRLSLDIVMEIAGSFPGTGCEKRLTAITAITTTKMEMSIRTPTISAAACSRGIAFAMGLRFGTGMITTGPREYS